MIGKNQRVGQNHILAPAGRKHDDLGNVVGGQGFAPFVNLVGGALVAVEPHDAELGLDLARIDFDDADARRDEFLAQGVGETAHGGFGRAVDAAARVGLAARDAADVDDVAGAGLAAGLQDGQDGLGHVDQAVDVGLEHGVDVGFGDRGRFGDALD